MQPPRVESADRSESSFPDELPTPSVAVAVATRDRPRSLARLIDSLLAQTRRPNEILIIDDGQLPDEPLAEWRQRCESAGVALVYHRKSLPGRSASRNLAGGLTHCDVVCFLDDDCEPQPPFMERMLVGLESYGRWRPGERESFDAMVAVEGLVIPPGGTRAGDRAFAVVQFLSGYWSLANTRWPTKLGDRLRSRPVLCGVCAVRRDALKATPFDDTLSHGEDREWSVRLSRLGRIGRATDAVCLHHVDPAGRKGAFAGGVRVARNYIHAQRKLFGLVGALLAGPTLVAMAVGQAMIGLTACATLRRSCGRWFAQSAGLIAGLFSPRGRRGDW